jgi:phosphatidylserine synthase 2
LFFPFSWASGALDPEGAAAHSSVTSIKRGVWAMIAVFLAYCTLQAPSTILIRPHPAVWRLVHGLAVVYLVAITFLLFQVIYICGSVVYYSVGIIAFCPMT